jgi:methylphosphotriester-DNA--protein-cysteine methyltransferase
MAGRAAFSGVYLMVADVRAVERLEGSTRSVKETMNAKGFKDESDFLRTFKNAYGVASSTYREKR